MTIDKHQANPSKHAASMLTVENATESHNMNGVEEHCHRKRKGTPHIFRKHQCTHQSTHYITERKRDTARRQQGKGDKECTLHAEKLAPQHRKAAQCDRFSNAQSDRLGKRPMCSAEDIPSNYCVAILFYAVASCPTLANKEQVRIQY